MKEIRRAFHTLKGSGRMVEADAIGDIAWSVENILNRVLDNTLAAGHSVFDLIDEIRSVIPKLVTAFENNQSIAVTGINIVQ